MLRFIWWREKLNLRELNEFTTVHLRRAPTLLISILPGIYSALKRRRKRKRKYNRKKYELGLVNSVHFRTSLISQGKRNAQIVLHSSYELFFFFVQCLRTKKLGKSRWNLSVTHGSASMTYASRYPIENFLLCDYKIIYIRQFLRYFTIYIIYVRGNIIVLTFFRLNYFSLIFITKFYVYIFITLWFLFFNCVSHHFISQNSKAEGKQHFIFYEIHQTSIQNT